MDILFILLLTLLAAIIGGFLFAIPGVTVFSISVPILIFWATHLQVYPSPLAICALLMSLVVSYSFINTVPALFFSAPDWSTLFLVRAGRKYLRRGCAYEGSMLVGIGSFVAIILIVAGTPLYFYLLKAALRLLRGYYLWILGALILYMVGGEFLHHLRRAKKLKLKAEYQALAAGPLIFLLIGVFGLLRMHYVKHVFIPGQGIMPSAIGITMSSTLIGLVLIPNLIWESVILTAPSRQDENQDQIGGSRAGFIEMGGLVGYIGGFLAMVVPGLSAGPGAFIAAHLSPKGEERAFLVSQGVVKTVYYVGAFLLFFIPYRHIMRGGMTLLLQPFYRPLLTQEYFSLLGVILISGAISFYMLTVASRIALKLTGILSGWRLPIAIILLMMIIVFLSSGFTGLAFMLMASCLGSLPFIFACRRSNVFAFTLLPAFMCFAGWMPRIMTMLGLD